MTEKPDHRVLFSHSGKVKGPLKQAENEQEADSSAEEVESSEEEGEAPPECKTFQIYSFSSTESNRRSPDHFRRKF